MSLENYSVDQIQELATLADSLAKNPKTRESFLRLTKAADPNTPIPEIDLKDQMRAYAKPFAEQIQSLERRFLEKDVKESIMSKRTALYEKGFKKDEVDAIEKLMVDKQIPSHDTASDFFRMQQRTATPTPSTMTPISLPQSAMEQMKKGQAGLNQWARGEAYGVIDSIKNGRTLV